MPPKTTPPKASPPKKPRRKTPGGKPDSPVQGLVEPDYNQLTLTHAQAKDLARQLKFYLRSGSFVEVPFKGFVLPALARDDSPVRGLVEAPLATPPRRASRKLYAASPYTA